MTNPKTVFEIDLNTHLLKNVSYVASPNHDERPNHINPELIVVHGISLPPQQFGGPGVVQLFTNQLNPLEHPYYAQIHQLKVSAHVFIRRDGQVIQFVPFHLRAWHAGLSNFKGRERCNDFSVGIELEGTDELPYEPIQYEQLAQIILALRAAYPTIKAENLVGHNDISPGRKTDPGEHFCWQTLQSSLNKSAEQIEI